MTDRVDPYDEDEAVFDLLGRGLPRVVPPDDLLGRILSTARLDLPAESERPARARQARWRGWLPIAGTAAAAAIAAAALTAVLETGASPGSAAARAVLSAQGGSAISGSADLYSPDRAGGKIRLRLRNVPLPAPGTHYELWLLPRGSTQMTATAAFTPAGHTVDLLLPLPAPEEYDAFEISVQPDNGPPQRSKTELASGTFAGKG